jgi:simple sugar transport system permease protein
MDKERPLKSGETPGVLLIMLVSLLLMTILVFFLSKTPLITIRWFFLGSFRNLYNFGNMLQNATPLIIGGLGVSIAMRADRFNLGGEGQIYFGAFTATITALLLAPLGLPGAFIAVLAGSFASGLVAAFSGFCRAVWETNEVITTFLLSNALVIVTNYLVTGPFNDPDTSLQATRKIGEAVRLPGILAPSNLSAALFIALALVAVTIFFIRATRTGYEIRISGYNEMFARYGGINTKWITIFTMFLSGAFYGLAGGLEVFGTYYGTVKEFSSGMGWNGLAVALIARFKPWAIIPSALFFAWIGSGARIAMQFSDITPEISSIVQAALLFLITSRVLRNLFAGDGSLK